MKVAAPLLVGVDESVDPLVAYAYSPLGAKPGRNLLGPFHHYSFLLPSRI